MNEEEPGIISMPLGWCGKVRKMVGLGTSCLWVVWSRGLKLTT